MNKRYFTIHKPLLGSDVLTGLTLVDAGHFVAEYHSRPSTCIYLEYKTGIALSMAMQISTIVSWVTTGVSYFDLRKCSLVCKICLRLPDGQDKYWVEM